MHINRSIGRTTGSPVVGRRLKHREFPGSTAPVGGQNYPEQENLSNVAPFHPGVDVSVNVRIILAVDIYLKDRVVVVKSVECDSSDYNNINF